MWEGPDKDVNIKGPGSLVAIFKSSYHIKYWASICVEGEFWEVTGSVEL